MTLQNDIKEFLESRTVLIVEPSANYRTSIKNFLFNLKVKSFRIVATVGEAKREMLTHKVGLFICEWQLPEKNGLIFCRELRKDKAYATVPFLLLSTENLRRDVIIASEGGVNGYLLKPFSFGDFSNQIHQIIHQIKNPSPFNAMMDRAESHLDQGEAWVAEALIKEALSLKPNSARAMTAIGRVHLINNDHVHAAESFRKAVELNPEYVEGYKYILQIAESSGDHRTILQYATILHQFSPENPRHPLMIARAQLELGDFDASEQMFQTAVKLSPTLADAYRGLGLVYIQKNHFEKASRAFEKALDLEKGDVRTLNSLGLSYLKLGRCEDGIRRYKMALSIDPFDARVLFNLGLAYAEFNQPRLAQESLQRAIAADPSFEKAKRQLARLQKNLPLTAEPSDTNKIKDAPPLKKGA